MVVPSPGRSPLTGLGRIFNAALPIVAMLGVIATSAGAQPLTIAPPPLVYPGPAHPRLQVPRVREPAVLPELLPYGSLQFRQSKPHPRLEAMPGLDRDLGEELPPPGGDLPGE